MVCGALYYRLMLAPQKSPSYTTSGLFVFAAHPPHQSHYLPHEVVVMQGKLIAHGALGNVYQGVDVVSGMLLAMKEGRGDGRMVARALHYENDILGRLDYVNVVK